MRVTSIERTEPDSQILYRLKYRGEVAGPKKTAEVFFVVELNPFGERSVYWESEPEGFDSGEQEQILKILQKLADHDQLPR